MQHTWTDFNRELNYILWQLYATSYVCNLPLEYVMYLHELYYVLTDVYARALAFVLLCSGVDLVALLRRTCVASRILKTLELVVAFLAPCPHYYAVSYKKFVKIQKDCTRVWCQMRWRCTIFNSKCWFTAMRACKNVWKYAIAHMLFESTVSFHLFTSFTSMPYVYMPFYRMRSNYSRTELSRCSRTGVTANIWT